MRKLARELDLSPDDVLSMLKDLGFDRYRTSEDLVADDVVARLRKRATSGVRTRPASPLQAVPLAARAPARPPSLGAVDAGPSVEVEGEDWMAAVVPGVLRSGAASARRPTRPPPPSGARRAGSPPGDARPAARSGPTLADERAEQVREALASERRRLEAVRDEIATERASLEQERAVLASERQALAAERVALEESTRAVDADRHRRSLLGLLEERGLVGLDEAERAVAALASGKAFGRALGTLIPADPEGMRRLLADRLVLVAGPVGEDLGPIVQVAPDRADVRAGPELDRQVSRLGAALLLEGLRRVVVAGVPPRLQTLLASGFDPRVELTFRPGVRRDEGQARQDIARADLVVTWNVDVTPGARSVYADARKRLVELRGRTMTEFLDGWYLSHRAV